jgi:hypothetical protein
MQRESNKRRIANDFTCRVRNARETPSPKLERHPKRGSQTIRSEMNLPTKAFNPEWSPSDNVIFYYDVKDGAFNLNARSKRAKIPKWMSDMIQREIDASWLAGSQDTKRKVRDLITQLKNL